MKRLVTIISFACVLWAACGDDSSKGTSVEAPSGLAVEAAADGGAHLTWMDAEGEEEFVIERKQGAGAWTMIGTVPFDTTQYHDATVSPGMAYLYRVSASAGGDRAPSAEVTFTAPADGAGGAGGGSAGSGGVGGSPDAGASGAAGDPHHGG